MVSKTDLAFWLGLYASAVASVTGLWMLFRELWVDRSRLVVTPEEVWLVNVKDQTRPMIVKGEQMLRTMGVPDSARKPVLTVTIRNRGRRDATIETVSQMLPDGRSNVFGDLLPQVPFLIPAERRTQVAIGQEGGYEHGEIPVRRFYVVDGAGRIHPLHERYRQRLQRIIHRSTSRPPLEEPRELEQ